MGIMGKISNIKAKFRGVQRAIEGGHREEAIKQARKLGITTEQIRERKLQEKVKYKETYDKERMRQIEIQAMQKAKAGTSVQRFAKGLKRTINESRERGKIRQKSVFENAGSKGLDYGTGNTNIGFGQKQKATPKKKKQIIINF